VVECFGEIGPVERELVVFVRKTAPKNQHLPDKNSKTTATPPTTTTQVLFVEELDEDPVKTLEDVFEFMGLDLLDEEGKKVLLLVFVRGPSPPALNHPDCITPTRAIKSRPHRPNLARVLLPGRSGNGSSKPTATG